MTDASRPEQREVLHVARAHLEHIGVLADQVHVFRAHDLGYDRETGEFTSFAQNFQCLNPQALKLVGRSARLVGSAAKHGSARALYTFRRLQQLLARLDRAGPGNDDHFRSTDLYAANIDH